VRLLEALYQDTMSVVRVDGGLSGWLATVIGVMQGCILSSLLFNIMLEVVIALALEDNEVGANISGVNIHCESKKGGTILLSISLLNIDRFS